MARSLRCYSGFTEKSQWSQMSVVVESHRGTRATGHTLVMPVCGIVVLDSWVSYSGVTLRNQSEVSKKSH